MNKVVLHQILYFFLLILNGCGPTELEVAQAELHKEQENMRKERQLNAAYFQAFQEIQKGINGIISENNLLRKNANKEVNVSWIDKMKNDFKLVEQKIKDTNAMLDSANVNSINLKSQIEGMKNNIAKQKYEIIKLKKTILSLRDENVELRDVNATLSNAVNEEKLNNQIKSTEIERLQNENSQLENKKRTLDTKNVNQSRKGIGKFCKIELNHKQIEKEITSDVITLTCNLKKSCIVSNHPSDSYYVSKNKIIIRDPSSFWRNSNTVIVRVEKEACGFGF